MEYEEYFEMAKEELEKSGLDKAVKKLMMRNAYYDAERAFYSQNEEWEEFKKQRHREDCSDEEVIKFIANATLINRLKQRSDKREEVGDDSGR